MDEGSAGKELAGQVRTLLDYLMGRLVAGIDMPERQDPPPDPPVVDWLDDLLSRQDTYRDAALAILAFPVAAGRPLDTTKRLPSDRAVTGHLERLLDSLAIRCRRDALQTIAKGSDSLIGRARESWNQLLTWAAAEDDVDQIRRAFHYLARGIAATARALPDMPAIDVSRLTFLEVAGLMDDLLAHPSGGAFEQFGFAAFYDAIIEELGLGRVATKTLNASDASAGTAADVQLLQGGVTLEAFEITASSWRSKVPQAVAVLRHYDLRRVHILGRGQIPDVSVLRAELPPEFDVTVLSVETEIRSLIARVQRTGRRAALNRLYEHLVQRQPRDDLVGLYVNALLESELTVAE